MLEPGDLLVVNETRVRAARLAGQRRDTGGSVELLVLGQLPDDTWEALARPSRRLHPGVVIEFGEEAATVVSEPDQGIVKITIDAPDPEATIARVGSVPLPPYFTGTLHSPDRYQTMFASELGSAAAPTAGLHFTETVTSSLTAREIGIVAVDLHVSLDTFRPISVEDIEDHRMHSEWCSIPEETAAAVSATRRRGGRIVAVGTTVVRTLESLSDGRGGVRAGGHKTDIFLKPGSRFDVVDMLITNFHMPGSTLLALLAGFMGDEWRPAYETALDRGYRFLSFGDAMLAARRDS